MPIIVACMTVPIIVAWMTVPMTIMGYFLWLPWFSVTKSINQKESNANDKHDYHNFDLVTKIRVLVVPLMRAMMSGNQLVYLLYFW